MNWHQSIMFTWGFKLHLTSATGSVFTRSTRTEPSYHIRIEDQVFSIFCKVKNKLIEVIYIHLEKSLKCKSLGDECPYLISQNKP